ncbi:MAG: leucyl aminopeptidase family protein [Rhizobiales bacterium]|nr:leucyl aminopeptidase family protein [Hyphomicrobiales bacterium]
MDAVALSRIGRFFISVSLTFAAAGKSAPGHAVPIHFVTRANRAGVERALAPAARAFLANLGFEATPGRLALAPDADGALAAVLFGAHEPGERGADPFLAGKLPALLPAGVYRFAEAGEGAAQAALAFLLGAYRFDRYRAKRTEAGVRLVAPPGVDAARIERIAQAVAMGRDLINTPANDLGPAELEAAARAFARRRRARVACVKGRALEKGFPLIAAVGRASARAPRLVDLRWGTRGPRVTLVGKGVCYDTGGLDIKPSSAMALMKKDMGGAAAALAAADMIVGAKLPVRLRVLLPIVENAVSGEAFRTGDVYRARNGLTVEIGNTDAEGRLILADALALAGEEAPDLLIDFATLTGAARVALGPDLPPFYTDDEALAAEIAQAGGAACDPVWRMPLWPAYERMLEGKIATVNSAPGGGFAGSIVAALFLRRFAGKAKSWAHFDIYGWTPAARPGRPEGGEPQAARLVYELVERRIRGGRRDAG